MRSGRPAALGLAAALLLLANARAQSAVAPDDPALIRNMAQLCMRAALMSGVICRAKIGATHSQ